MKKNLPLPVCLFLTCWLIVMPFVTPADEAQKGIILITGPETSDLLRSLGEPLQRAAGIQSGDIHFHVVQDNVLNAMALPGQNIVLNSGLLLAVHDRDELAAVMAHEIGHLSAGHHIQIAATMQDVALRTMIAFAAGIAAGVATGNSQVAQAAILGGAASSQASLLDTIREKETQADRLAIGYLVKAGFDPRGMVRFMEHLNRDQRLNNMPPPYLLTHPLSTQRMMESQQQIDALALPDVPVAPATSQASHKAPAPMDASQPGTVAKNKATDDALLARVQAVLEAGTSNDLNEAIARFQKRLDLDPDNFPARYGLAIAERYMGQLPAAATDLEQLLKQQAHDPYLLRERGMVQLELGKPTLAETDFRAALIYQPKQTNADLLYRLAFSLNEQDQPDKLTDASRILRPLTLEYPLVADYFYLLGVVEGKQNHLGASHLALARHAFLTMEKKMARWHYQEAIRNFSSADTGRNIAKDELARLEKLEKESSRWGRQPPEQ
ncbi:MAG: M48 family metalloprotease [Magnetococcales bacterium]|nr:M48 family metalloprotease [Magnetococcales bacterium]